MKKILIVLLLTLSLNVFCLDDVKTYIPQNAKIYVPLLKEQQIKYWPTHPRPEVLAGLIEQESCIFLRHKLCWNPSSKLQTAREFGAGFGQITKAYKADGSIRFDALQELKNKHSVLSEWNWNNVLIRPDLQLAGIVLKSNDDYKTLSLIKDPVVRLHFADAAYNGGMGGVNNERRACGLSKNCNPQLWFNNVEMTCLKGNKPIYGQRTACMINREHVTNVFKLRSEKYKVFFK